MSLPAHRSAEHYRGEAARCRSLADAALDEAVQRTLHDVASTYDAMARQVVELEQFNSRVGILCSGEGPDDHSAQDAD